MAQQHIDTGSVPNSVGGESLRSAFDKVNDNFTELGSLLDLGSSYVSNILIQKRSTSEDGYRCFFPYARSNSGNTLIWPSETGTFDAPNYINTITTGNTVQTTIKIYPTGNSNTGTWTYGIALNPTINSNVSDTDFDFEQNFDSSVNEHNFNTPLNFTSGDLIGIAINTPSIASEIGLSINQIIRYDL